MSGANSLGVSAMETQHTGLKKWVDEVAALTKPDAVVWCDGSEGERDRLTQECLKTGELIALNQEKMPGCYLHRSAAHDVARTEHLTFICTETAAEAGPTNNWMAPNEARAKVGKLYEGAMKGRTMFVVPFLMGPAGSKFSKVGVEITDSRYVVLNMRIMTRMGKVALDHLGTNGDFTRCLHALGDLSPERRFICHFPQNNEIWSVGSGYGGNALLGKKCMALRIAGYLGKQEGWLAEHMLILGLRDPEGKMHYITGAFPSACGKTNMAMLEPPKSMPGWQAFTYGDDIAWLRPGDDGRLYAVNPEAGFFGVVPGTGSKTNPAAYRMIQKNTIFTNVALREDGTPWWEGHDDPPPQKCLDWQGRPWTPDSTEKAAHPNSRFTVPASQCETIAPDWENPNGVPIEAMLFGARRQRVVPLVYQSRNWQHGTFLAATVSSETTAAATGKVGVLRRDPMAMLPFCGYNMADYWAHWLEMGTKLKQPPLIFRVNWFRTGENGKFLWPGYGENLRVLAWVIDRVAGKGESVETPIGITPTRTALNRSGIDLSDQAVDQLLKVDVPEWAEALAGQEEFFAKFGDRLPKGIREEHLGLRQRILSTPDHNIDH